MSVWTDIHKRSIGVTVSKEDFNLIYGHYDKAETLFTKKYRDGTYEICTNGSYPFLNIDFKIGLSIFAGMDIIKLKSDDGEYYDLPRWCTWDGVTRFTYKFNKEDDYVADHEEHMSELDPPHDGHKYTLDELKKIAEMFINLIHKCEEELADHME